MQKTRTNTAVWLENQKRWQINVQKDGIRRTFTCSKPGRAGQREANAKADAWLDDNIEDSGKRVDVLFDQWIEMLQSEVSYSSWSQYEAYGKTWIKPAIGRLQIGRVTEVHLQKILNQMNEAGRAKKTISNVCACLKAFFKYARSCRCTTLFPESLHVPRSAQAKQKTILQPEDLKVLFSKDTTRINRGERPEPYINAYRFEVATGMRPGEIRGLKWEDIRGGICTIRRSINRWDEETRGKNDNARRSFALTDLASGILDRQRALLDDLGIESEWVFPDEEGNAIIYVNWYEHWRRYVRNEGLSQCTPYGLRHTFVSMVKSLPDGYLRPLIGHAESMDTLGVYSHEVDGDRQITANLVQGIFDIYLNGKTPSGL